MTEEEKKVDGAKAAAVRAGALVFQPTKTWFKEHHRKPPECMVPDCTCILDHFNDNHQGYCVGFYPYNGDLDMISFCFVSWNNRSNRLERQNMLLHPSEASMIAVCLGLAVTEVIEWIPDYRQSIGRMARKRTRDIKKSGVGPDMITDPIALRDESSGAGQKRDGK